MVTQSYSDVGTPTHTYTLRPTAYCWADLPFVYVFNSSRQPDSIRRALNSSTSLDLSFKKSS